MKCNKCGNICDDNSKFCTKCGNDLANQRNESFSEIGSGLAEFKQAEVRSLLEGVLASKRLISICAGIFILAGVIYGLHSLNLPKVFKEAITPKAENCESQVVKDLVIDIVKNNDYFYNDIDPDTISTIYLRFPATSGYEQDIDKYHCTAQFVMESIYGGFKPKAHDFSNRYYSKYHFYRNFNDEMLTTNTQYVCDVKYTSQLSEGSTLVNTTYCNSSGSWYESGKSGKFSCEGGNCEASPIYRKEQESMEDSNDSYTESSSNDYNSYSEENYSYPTSNHDVAPQPKVKQKNEEDSFHAIESNSNINNVKPNNVKRDIEEAEDELF